MATRRGFLKAFFEKSVSFFKDSRKFNLPQFRIKADRASSLSLELERVKAQLPDGINLYSVDDVAIFPVYDNDGGLSFKSCSFLTTAPDQLGGLGGLHFYNQSIYHPGLIDEAPSVIANRILDAVPIFMLNLASARGLQVPGPCISFKDRPKSGFQQENYAEPHS